MGHGEPYDDGPGDEPDTAPLGAPPHPLDRVWLHPSELSSRARATIAGDAASGRATAWFIPVVAGVAGALATIVVLAMSGSLDRASSQNAQIPATGETTAKLVPASAFSAIGRSVVAITARDGNVVRHGSGVCIRHGGEVLSSARLVGSATTVAIITSDGLSHDARVVGIDRITDLALLAFDANIPAARLAHDAAEPRAPVWIVGTTAPSASEPWMSAGIVSSVDAISTSELGPTMNGLMETDAAIAAHTRGGALVDADGAVTGIVLGSVDGSETTYAVPIRVAIAIAEQLRANGVARHGSMGMEGSDSSRGPTVAKVVPNGPAALAGVRKGDVVVAVDSRLVDSMGAVLAMVRGSDPGETMTLELRRGTRAMRVEVQLASVAG
jgi:serine protease DegS